MALRSVKSVEAIRTNAQQLNNLGSPLNLSRWLLTSLQTRDFEPLVIIEPPSDRHQIVETVNCSSPVVQDRFRYAVDRAIVEFRFAQHSLSSLQDLAYIALDVGATASINALRDRIKYLNELLRRDRDNEQIYSTMSTLVGVIGGFAPLDEARVVLSQLLFDDLFDHRLAAKLTSGLCRCQPDRFSEFIGRFHTLADRVPGHFQIRRAFDEFVRVVSPITIVEGLSTIIDQQLRDWLIVSVLEAPSTSEELKRQVYEITAQAVRKPVGVYMGDLQATVQHSAKMTEQISPWQH